MTTGKTIALTMWTFVSRVMSLLFRDTALLTKVYVVKAMVFLVVMYSC